MNWPNRGNAEYRREWMKAYLVALDKIRKAQSYSKNKVARHGTIYATRSGIAYGGGLTDSWECVSLSGIKKMASWNWVPSMPMSPLELLAKCAK